MRSLFNIWFVIVLLNALFSACDVVAQDTTRRKIAIRDSVDHAIDLSDYMIYSNGFIVVPTVITEPSLGGIGGALIPVFLKKRPSVVDTVNGKVRITRVNPDITGAMGMYTANKSWMVGGFRSGTFVKPRITYRVAVAYADVNLSFYKTLPVVGEKEFKFNFETVPIYLQTLKLFNNSKWSAGIQYLFTRTKLSAVGDSLPSFVRDKEIKSTISQIGGILQFDGRDNLFTPDRGFRLQTDFFWSDSFIGSDYDSWRIGYSGIGYLPVASKLTGGLRIEGQQSLGDPPFYLLPSIDLRGVPASRYQGKATLLTEIETRWDFYKRWSAVFYGGAGLAYNDWGNMFQNDLVYNYGTGFRYLLARKFKLRMGADIARGPEKFAYYVVFGSSWFR